MKVLTLSIKQFQSTHLREVRHKNVLLRLKNKSFNPRTYERCDKVSKNTFDWSHSFQSTHLREVRPKGIDQATLSRSFNPRTYERCDIKLLFTFVSVQFQSTHLREVRPKGIDQATLSRSFNPRTYERCDTCGTWTCSTRTVSIHAPTRGATKRGHQQGHRRRVSIHAPTRGATSSPLGSCPILVGFNPRTYERCDSHLLARIAVIHTFQSTHLREVRPKG